MSKSFQSLISRSLRVWVNMPDKDKKGITFNISKRYKDKQSDEWKESKVLFPEDVAALMDVLPRALTWAGENVNASTAAVGNATTIDIPFGDQKEAPSEEDTKPATDDDNIPW